MATALAADMTDRDRSRDRTMVRIWLYAIALLVVVMVVVGGATRLTDSGLSITEWKPIHGVVPPLSDAEWQEEFLKYQQIPEYRILNHGMSLEEFKGIFWWEWTHRFLGRLIGVAFLLPLIFFWVTGRIERAMLPKLGALFVLGGLQGAIGWWMVTSGLSVRTDVSQYRLAIHLTFACVILAAILWVAGGLRERRSAAPPAVRRMGLVLLGLVFLQIFLGALVAGLDAGLVTDEWPLMNGALVPGELFFHEPAWINLFDNPVTVHFDHRIVAYVLLIVSAAHAWQTRGTRYGRRALTLAALVVGQAILGILTVLHGVPLWLALAHQFGAVAVLAHAVTNLRAMVPNARVEPAAA